MIKRLLRRLINWAQDLDHCNALSVSSCRPDIEMPSPVRFKIQQATGGTIVEIAHYDSKRDQNRVNLHVIPDSESDMPRAIARIVTCELLKA